MNYKEKRLSAGMYLYDQPLFPPPIHPTLKLLVTKAWLWPDLNDTGFAPLQLQVCPYRVHSPELILNVQFLISPVTFNGLKKKK